ncbi:hypothetical protein BDW02DRAFT_576036 [Decorospora gaudefroyi]|uniref:Uncharacterized protein n=1 Tax=Decorospora gaudefroyi TaxID=184978 RepID=A0A6A5KRM8_9PLEO|nr:hypothetical protein BDW02DRAFT_576036 [Decorospora gaudefroyi]
MSLWFSFIVVVGLSWLAARGCGGQREDWSHWQLKLPSQSERAVTAVATELDWGRRTLWCCGGFAEAANSASVLPKQVEIAADGAFDATVASGLRRRSLLCDGRAVVPSKVWCRSRERQANANTDYGSRHAGIAPEATDDDGCTFRSRVYGL